MNINYCQVGNFTPSASGNLTTNGGSEYTIIDELYDEIMANPDHLKKIEQEMIEMIKDSDRTILVKERELQK